jgi:hypothetical protein
MSSAKELANWLQVAGSRQASLQSFSVGIKNCPLKKNRRGAQDRFSLYFPFMSGAAPSVKWTSFYVQWPVNLSFSRNNILWICSPRLYHFATLHMKYLQYFE